MNSKMQEARGKTEREKNCMKFLTTLCMAALSCSIFRMLVPENKFSKQISLLIAAVFLLTGITALKGADLSIDTEQYRVQYEEYGSEISSEVNGELRERICREMSDRIYALLNERGIYPEEIHIIVNISGLYSIDITQVELVFPDGEQAAAEAAAELLAGELSSDIEIRTEVRAKG